MEWLDYRKLLNIGFNDNDKFNYFATKLFNWLAFPNKLSDGEYFSFCNATGTKMQMRLMNEYSYSERHEEVCKVITYNSRNLSETLFYVITYANILRDSKERDTVLQILKNMLAESQIQYDVIEDKDGVFIFPKGAPELDDALVSQPLTWLKSYPKAYKTFCNALRQYSDGVYIRDVADNLRKALEEFFQEFLGNTKNLANNKTAIYKYLSKNNSQKEVASMFQALISSYDTINNEVAKHNDKMDSKYLEFLLYQTGVFIRVLITVKNSTEDKSDAH